MLTNLTNRTGGDRFIQNRQHTKQQQMLASPPGKSSSESLYQHLIKNNLFSTQDTVSSFSSQQNLASAEEYFNKKEYVSKLQPNVNSPVKILDVPRYKDDFYLNNIDWSQKGPIGIALDNQVFTYTPENLQQIRTENFGSYVTGLKMHDQLMSIGHSNGAIELFDIEKGQRVRKLLKHENRVSALMFIDNLLVSGSKDKFILVHDLRLQDHVVKTFNKHKGEVCTLKAKNVSERVFASGSVDGSAIIWDIMYGFIDQLKGHNGAVKALDWCPWKNGILATGGGNNSEKSIKIWNTTNSSLLWKQPVQSQISGILWNSELNMMISSHGYSQNELNFWSLDSTEAGSCRMTNRKQFKSHDGRILSMQQSHDQSYLCTVGADETLKFWYLFESTNTNPFHRETSKSPYGSPQRI